MADFQTCFIVKTPYIAKKTLRPARGGVRPFSVIRILVICKGVAWLKPYGKRNGVEWLHHAKGKEHNERNTPAPVRTLQGTHARARCAKNFRDFFLPCK